MPLPDKNLVGPEQSVDWFHVLVVLNSKASTPITSLIMENKVMVHTGFVGASCVNCKDFWDILNIGFVDQLKLITWNLRS
jgi:hypothetical protein